MVELCYGNTLISFKDEDILKPELHYTKLCNIKSDINEHLPTLKRYSEECERVTEMGVRFACSTWAFIEAKPKRLTCIDINKTGFEPSEKYIKKLCENYGINFKWITGDSLEIEIEDTDLLFIDTLHTYGQLIRELKKHESKVSKYIILHDTQNFGTRNEDIYNHASDIIKNTRQEKIGLLAAINEFIEENKNWFVKEVFLNNNGLTILSRRL
jgi:hypothetical protein